MQNENESIISYIRNFVSQGYSAIRKHIVAGDLNTNFIRGNQNIRIDSSSLKIVVNNDPSVDKRIFNRMTPIYLTRYGLLSNNMPIPGFKQTDVSSKSISDSLKGNVFINHVLNDISFKTKYCKLIRQADVYGACWFKTGIDWSKGEGIATVNVSTSGEEDETTKTKYTIKEGRVFCDVVPIREVYVDNMAAESMDDINELCHQRIFDVDIIKRRFGIEVKPQEAFFVLDSAYKNKRYSTKTKLTTAPVVEYYAKPSVEYSDGRYVMLIGDKVYYDGPLPYINGVNGKRDIPFDLVSLQTTPDNLIGISVYTQLIPIQETLNQAKNSYLQYIKRIAIGQYFVYENSLSEGKTFSLKPGKPIYLKRNSKAPMPVQTDRLSSEYISYIRTLEEDMLITAGLSQLTAYGASKSNVRTDGVVDKIDESDQNKLVNAVDNLSALVINVFKKLLYCEKERVQILKKQLELNTLDDYAVRFSLDNVDPEQIVIVNRDFLMQSDQVMDKKVQQASSLGLYNANMGMSFVSKMEMINALKSNFLLDTLDPIERANHDIICDEHFQLLENNLQLKVETFHAHEQHIYEHDLFRMSADLRSLKAKDQKKYELIMSALESHINDHRKQISSKQSSQDFNGAKAVFNGTADSSAKAK